MDYPGMQFSHCSGLTVEVAAVLQAEPYFTFAKNVVKGTWAKIVRKEKKKPDFQTTCEY